MMMTTIPLNDATPSEGVHTKMAHRNSTGTADTFDSDDKTFGSVDGDEEEAPVANFDGLKQDLEAAVEGSEVDDKSGRGNIDMSDSTSKNDSNQDTTTKSDGTTSCTGGNGNTSTSNSKFSLARQESADIVKLRALVICVLLIAAGAVSAVVYIMSRNAEVSEYNDQYDASVKVVLDSFLNIMDAKMGIVSTLGVALIAQAVESKTEFWPFVTLSNFHERAATAVKQSGTILIHTSPVVTVDNRDEWEVYAAGNASNWIQEGLDYQTDMGMFDWRTSTSWSQDELANFTKDGRRPIWRLNFEGDAVPELGMGPYMPVWQTTPVIYGGSGVNENLFRQDIDKAGAKLCIESGMFVMGTMLTPPPPGFEDEAYIHDDNLRINYIDKNMSALLTTLLTVVKKEKMEYEGGPVSHVYFPIFDSFQQDRQPQAVMTAWIHWMDYFKKILPPIIRGVDIVLTNTCDKAEFTMRINGDEVIALGRGDYHERKYDSMKRSASFETVTNIDDGTKYGLPFNKNHCMVQMDVYPTDIFYNIFNTETPAIVTSAVAIVFLISVILFFVYDYLIQARQNMVMDRAHKTQKLVTSLFPAEVAERMMDQAAKESEMKKKNGKNVFLNANQAFTGMLTEDQMHDQEDDTPIADLFPFCTVLFCDISGFTAWSSAREPAQVFILLQTLYEAFDRVAKRRKVFKVETIGDSYVAVTGLPEPQKNHAVIMTRFAGECLTKMLELVQLLEPRLGPDTADLNMRFGLHSGQVTAGVLRGAKSRFQLFGDTVNTASRMESTGVPGRIQISESTYKLLKEAGKHKWLQARTDNVTAKGKGSLKTWWVNPCVKRASSVSGSSATGSATEVSNDLGTLVIKSPAQILADKFKKQIDLDAKDRRLVTWICDLLHEQIQKVIVMRESAAKVSGVTETKDISWHENETKGANTMDEVKDALITPAFCQKAYDDQEDFRTARLGEDAMKELFDLITLIAKSYHKNPFHNFEHACHVTMSVSKFIKRITQPGIAKVEENSDHDFTIGINSDPLTLLGIIFSAVIHDVDHRGVSNVQLAKEKPELGEKYRNRSVAEQNSLDLTWNLFMQDRFVNLRNTFLTTDEEMRRFRAVLVNVVLATDIFDKDLNDQRKERWDKAFASGKAGMIDHDERDALRSSIVIEHIIQASDVSHSMQHWHIYRKWNAKLFEEMYSAWKMGRMAKNPAEFWYNGELGFFDNYIIPLAHKLKECQVFGVSSYECLDYAIQNRNEWKERGRQLVDDMLREVSSPMDGKNLQSLDEDQPEKVEAPIPPIPSVIGQDSQEQEKIVALGASRPPCAA